MDGYLVISQRHRYILYSHEKKKNPVCTTIGASFVEAKEKGSVLQILQQGMLMSVKDK
jgi:hypothetical protein